MNLLSMVEARLPAGFRFHPRDDELVCEYLRPKASGGGLYSCPAAMVDVDLNKCEPWDLPGIALVGKKEWYFFSLKNGKYATGHRTNRATLSGYWKATGKDRRVTRRGLTVGMRKTLVFYIGRAPKGNKTEWVMHEFRIEGLHDPPKLNFKQKSLEAAINDINNSFGKGSVTRLGSAGGALVETFPSGCLTLDFALGGGLPKGRIVEIFGPESSGKTTLALHAIAEVQKLGGNALLVDAEHAFDPAYSRSLGVDIENLIVCQPDHGEMALEIADRMCRSGAIDLICVDSVSALTPRAEIEGEIGMQQMGLQARLMSQALRKMSGNASKAGCTLIFLNQIRYKIGVFYGNPEVTSGGIALKFFASLRLEIRAIGKIKSAKGDEDVGVKVRVRVQKSKVSRPYKQAEFEILFGEGVSKLGCILDCAEMMDVVAKKGSWYSFGDQRLGQGRDKALQFLRENPLICNEVEKAVRALMTEGSTHMSLIAFGQSPTVDDEDI